MVGEKFSLMRISLTSAGKYIPGWLTNAFKIVASKLPKFAPGFVGTATTAINASKYIIASVHLYTNIPMYQYRYSSTATKL